MADHLELNISSRSGCDVVTQSEFSRDLGIHQEPVYSKEFKAVLKVCAKVNNPLFAYIMNILV